MTCKWFVKPYLYRVYFAVNSVSIGMLKVLTRFLIYLVLSIYLLRVKCIVNLYALLTFLKLNNIFIKVQ